ncbi:MAG: hypothetical protein ACOZIN_18230 [Myxococcota bacterium]
MSVEKIRALLSQVAFDRVITLAEVHQLIEVASDEQVVTPGEKFLLQAALEAHERQFTPEAYRALQDFLRQAKG